MFDDFDLFETCEEYYDDTENQDFQYKLTIEDQVELNRLFG